MILSFESIDFELLDTKEKDYFKDTNLNMDSIIKVIDNICLKIRERIGVVSVLE